MKKWGSYFIVPFIVCLIAILIFFQIIKHNFNEETFNIKNVSKNIEELSSQKYEGREAGSEGNALEVKYLEDYFKSIDLKPAGDNNTYLQNFKTMLPVYNSVPRFNIMDSNNNIVRSFSYGDEFLDSLNGVGGTGAVKGKLFCFNSKIKALDSAYIKDNILFSLNSLSDTDLQYAADNGCKAIIFPVDKLTEKKPFNMNSKTGASMLIYKISKNLIEQLMSYSNDRYNIDLNLDVTYKMLDTPNFLAKIDGTDSSAGYIILSSHLDGVGKLGSSTFIQGSSHDASGTAILMELARTMSLQRSKPKNTIIFAAWNSFEQEQRGANYYVENPIYQLKYSQVISLDGIGNKLTDSLYLCSYGIVGDALKNKLVSYNSNKNITLRSSNAYQGTDIEPFVSKDTPAVLLQGDAEQNLVNSVDDNIKNISQDNLQAGTNILLKYIHRDVYRDFYHGMFNSCEIYIFISMLGIWIIIAILKLLYRIMPGLKLVKIDIKDIYYSTVFKITEKLIEFILIIALVLFLIVFIIYVPGNFDVVHSNLGYTTNYSIFVIAEKAIQFIRNIMAHGFGKTNSGFSISFIISFSIIRSLVLIICSVAFAFLVGTIKGTIGGFRNKKGNGFKFLGSIAILSLPDVFIAIILQLLMVYMYEHKILLFLLGTDERSRFIFPFISLAIIPTAYISRIAEIAVKEELNKDYIIAARAKGLSNFIIIKSHLFISVVIKVVESLPSVLNIIISNLIIVEYYFAYPGIIYEMFSYFKDGDIRTSIALIFGIGIVYMILSILFKLIAIIINPVKWNKSIISSGGTK